MGGGCEAIRGLMEGGWAIRITDGEDFIWGTLGERDEREADGEPQGWMIGIYKYDGPDEEGAQEWTVGVVDYDAKTADLPRLVGGAIRRLRDGDHDTHEQGHSK